MNAFHGIGSNDNILKMIPSGSVFLVVELLHSTNGVFPSTNGVLPSTSKATVFFDNLYFKVFLNCATAFSIKLDQHLKNRS